MKHFSFYSFVETKFALKKYVANKIRIRYQNFYNFSIPRKQIIILLALPGGNKILNVALRSYVLTH